MSSVRADRCIPEVDGVFERAISIREEFPNGVLLIAERGLYGLESAGAGGG